jgi:formylglycine-generating enzyme required for sulfatase activity
MIEGVRLPLPFGVIHCENLTDWDGDPASPVFRKLVDDVAALVGSPSVQAQREPQQEVPITLPELLSMLSGWMKSPVVVVVLVGLIAMGLLVAIQFGGEQDTPSTAPEGEPVVTHDSAAESIAPIELDMVPIPKGSFWMGSPKGEVGRHDDEGPQRRVSIAQPFAIGKYEITFDEYDRFARASGRELPPDSAWGRGKRPVINVSWEDAVAYAGWLSERTGKRYRLPTEAEWEYAARAGTQTRYWWGDEIGRDRANCSGCGSQWEANQTVPVGSFEPNGFGLHDMLGNVWEWVEDCWHGNYQGAPADGSAWTEGGNCGRRVVRGGSWGDGPRGVRSARRRGNSASFRDHFIGFRLAQDL